MSGPQPGTPPEYLLVKRGLYYRPDNSGYTGIKDHAGRYDASEARPDSGVTAIHQNEAPEFSPACFEDLAREHLSAKRTAAITERDHAWECADRLAEALECVLDDSHSYESEGYARQDARQALAEYRKAR